MDSNALTGDIAQRNPFAAADRANKQASLSAQQDEVARQQAAESRKAEELKQRRREAARREKESQLQSQIARRAQQLEQQQEEVERLRAAKIAAENRARELEEQQQKMQEQAAAREAELQRERQEAQERAALAEEERQRTKAKAEAEARRLAAIRQAEEQAETTAQMITASRELQTRLDQAYEQHVISRREHEEWHAQVWALSKPEKDDLLDLLQSKLDSAKEQQHVATTTTTTASFSSGARPSQTQSAPSVSSAPAVQPEIVRSRQTDAFDEAEMQKRVQEEVKRQMALQEAQYKFQVIAASSMTWSQIVAALSKSADDDAAVFSLQKQLTDAIAAHGLSYLQENLDDIKMLGVQLPSVIRNIGKMALQRPAHMAAHICLGLLGFSGHPTAFRAVKETSAIPTSVHQWLGCIIGIRLWLEYCSFKTRQATQAGARFTVYADKFQTPFSKGQALSNKQEQQKLAAREKIKDLISIYGVNFGESGAKVDVDEHLPFIMDKFEAMAAYTSTNQDKLNQIAIDFEKRVAGQLDASDKDNSLAATRARLAAAQEESHKLKQDLERVNKEEDELQLQLRKLEAELSQLGAM